MATKQEPIRRNDVIRCEKCGEDYSVTYKRCPFCDERPTRSSGAKPIRFGGRRVAGGGGGYSGNRVNPLQIAGLVLSLVLIIAALYIVFTAIGPLLGKDKPDDKSNQSQSSVSTSQSAPGSSSSADSSGDVSVPEQPPVVAVTSLSLDRSEFTLKANEAWKINASVTPSDATVTWTSSNEAAAKVGADGTVVNVNTGSAQVKVTITATAGDKTAECVVYCRGGSTGTATPPSTTTTPGASTSGTSISAGSVGRVTNAEYGLRVRSGPGSSYDPIASLTNGSTVTILEDTGSGWYKITFVGNGGRDTEGYVSKDYISAG